MQIAFREWTDGDAGWYVERSMDPEILRFTTTEPTLTADSFRAALGRLRADDDALAYVAVDATTGTRLANVAANRDGRSAHVSYWVERSARGRGVASESLRMLCREVFDAWPVDEIRLWAHADNVGSQRAAENAGFTYIESADEVREVKGDDWPARWYRLGRTSAPQHPRSGQYPA